MSDGPDPHDMLDRADRFRRDSIAELAAMTTRLRTMAADAAAGAERIATAREELVGARVTAHSRDSAVTVTVNGLGEIQSVGLDPERYRGMGDRALGDAVVATLVRARAEADRVRAESMAAARA